VDILKAYSSYSKKYPNEIKPDRAFTQTLMNYAQFGVPHKAAKYAVNILLAKNDDKSKVTATNLLQKVIKKLEYGSPNLLNKLATISQLERLVPTVTTDADDQISEFTIKGLLREVRTDSKSSDPAWVNEPDMDDELQAKCLALKILVNRQLAGADEEGSETRVKAIIKLLKTFVVQEGEFCKVKDTPLHHKKRLRLLAGQYMLKICTIKKYDDQLDAASFNKLAELVQDSEHQVRRRFMEKLQSYLTRGALRPRFYTILFLVAFEPVSDLKARVETWIRSRARFYADNKKQIMEAMIGRLLPLLAHHPDYSPALEDLADFAKYILFYLSTVATEENISLIYKYAERVKQTRDALSPESSENLYVLSDLAQAAIRKYQEKRNWSFQAWPEKVGLPTGLYTALPSSEVAQQIAKKLYIPEEMDEKLDDLLRVMERKKVCYFCFVSLSTRRHNSLERILTCGFKKRKSIGEGTQPSKRPKGLIKTVIREKADAKPKSTKAASKKAAKAKKPSRVKKASSPSMDVGERRRSGRAHKSLDYKERDDAEDETEMLDGVAEWDYGGDDSEGSEADSGSEENDEEKSDAEEPSQSESNDEDTRPTRPKAAVKAKVLAGVQRGSRSARGRGSRAAQADVNMDVDDDDDD
jgi:sister chromatid cohesion protein PDS5